MFSGASHFISQHRLATFHLILGSLIFLATSYFAFSFFLAMYYVTSTWSVDTLFFSFFRGLLVFLFILGLMNILVSVLVIKRRHKVWSVISGGVVFLTVLALVLTYFSPFPSPSTLAFFDRCHAINNESVNANRLESLRGYCLIPQSQMRRACTMPGMEKYISLLRGYHRNAGHVLAAVNAPVAVNPDSTLEIYSSPLDFQGWYCHLAPSFTEQQRIVMHTQVKYQVHGAIACLIDDFPNYDPMTHQYSNLKAIWAELWSSWQFCHQMS